MREGYPPGLWRPRGRTGGVSKARVLFLVIPFVWLLLCVSSSAEPLRVPQLQGYVNDYAGMITPETKEKLEHALRAFERSDSTQIVILTIPTLDGEALEDFSIKVADTWKIGQKDRDNGALLFVAKQERKIRIEVGRGLEGRLTDLMSGRIIDRVVKPRFQKGDIDGGFVAGVSAMIDATRGEFKANGNGRQRKRDPFTSIFPMLLFGGFIILVMGSISRVLGGIAGAALFAGAFSFLPISAGVIAYLVSAGLGFGAGMLLPVLFSSGGRHSRSGGFWIGGPGIGGGFGGGIGGGGFSGGGGGFGGGGASGGW